MPPPTDSTAPVLVAGASGYVGGRLITALREAGHAVRAMARRPEELASRIEGDVPVMRGDVFEPETLQQAMDGVSVAFYLIHSMGADEDFEERDRVAASNFAAAAERAGVRRIVYLGGLGTGPDLSPHLRSRQEVGRILRESPVDTIELRASVIIGSGSLSHELIRSLVERLPVMITPRWVRVPTQPIAVEDVIDYLVAAVDLGGTGSRVFEIGGEDRVSYGDLMREYARQRGLRRLMIEVPVLTPRLSSLWLGLVTPVYAHVGRKLIDGLRNPTVVEDTAALSAFSIRPRGVGDAIARALQNEDARIARTRWSDTRSVQKPAKGWGGRRFGARIVDSRARRVDLSPSRAFAPIRRIGGETGWHYGDWLWRLRGFLDLLVGGAGLRRGRRDPELVRPGDTLDFWRVEAFEPDRLLRLRAEMRLPGRAWLQFEVSPEGDGSEVRQTAIFDPLGLAGLAYWYALYPLHHLVFEGMLRGICAVPESADHA
jgi:uncharacterized protein YbjT (DUF2867 family)